MWWWRLIIAIVLLAAVGVAGYRAHERVLPSLEPAPEPHLVGTYHVHTAASHDSDSELRDLARLARELNIDFLVVTDHNTQLTNPVEVDGVVVLSHAELSTPFGHVVELGATKLLEHEDRDGLDVLRKIRELGGIPMAAHPADPKRPWTGPVDGLGGFEIASASASARRRGGPIFAGLLPALAAYRLNPTLAVAQTLERNDAALRRWDAESDPAMVGLCGVDAHGRFLDSALELQGWHTVIDGSLPADRKRLPAAIVEALSRGRFHCVAGLVARDPDFEFVGLWDGQPAAVPGDTVATTAIDALMARSPRSTVETATIVLLRNGEEVARSQGGRLEYAEPVPGTYRVEVLLPIPGVLWGYRVVPVIYSNRIRVASDLDSLPPGPAPRTGAPYPNLLVSKKAAKPRQRKPKTATPKPPDTTPQTKASADKADAKAKPADAAPETREQPATVSKTTEAPAKQKTRQPAPKAHEPQTKQKTTAPPATRIEKTKPPAQPDPGAEPANPKGQTKVPP